MVYTGGHFVVVVVVVEIAQFRYIKIQPKTIDLSTRLQGINYRVCGVYSPEPRSDVYSFRLNFLKIFTFCKLYF